MSVFENISINNISINNNNKNVNNKKKIDYLFYQKIKEYHYFTIKYYKNEL